MASKIELVKTGEDDVWEYFDRFVDGVFYCKSLKWKG